MTITDTAADPFRDDLTRRMKAAAEDPFSNAFVRFAPDAGQQDTQALQAAVVELTSQGFEARAERLGRYLEVTSPADNTKAVSDLFDQLAGEDGEFDTFRDVLERPGFGIVLTGHPTFALSFKLSRILVELATGLDETGAPLSEADRDDRLARARALRHGPPAELSLNVEHRWSVTALNGAAGQTGGPSSRRAC
jgi:phosphoenolpyruvate carboxylase